MFLLSGIPLAFFYAAAPYSSSLADPRVESAVKAGLIGGSALFLGAVIAASGLRPSLAWAAGSVYLFSRIGPAIESPFVRRLPELLLFGLPDVMLLVVAFAGAAAGVFLCGPASMLLQRAFAQGASTDQSPT